MPVVNQKKRKAMAKVLVSTIMELLEDERKGERGERPKNILLRKGHGGLCKASKRKKEESKRLRGERDQIKYIHLDLKEGRL